MVYIEKNPNTVGIEALKHDLFEIYLMTKSAMETFHEVRHSTFSMATAGDYGVPYFADDMKRDILLGELYEKLLKLERKLKNADQFKSLASCAGEMKFCAARMLTGDAHDGDEMSEIETFLTSVVERIKKVMVKPSVGKLNYNKELFEKKPHADFFKIKWAEESIPEGELNWLKREHLFAFADERLKLKWVEYKRNDMRTLAEAEEFFYKNRLKNSRTIGDVADSSLLAEVKIREKISIKNCKNILISLEKMYKNIKNDKVSEWTKIGIERLSRLQSTWKETELVPYDFNFLDQIEDALMEGIRKEIEDKTITPIKI